MSPWEGLNRRRFPRVNYPCMVTVWQADDNSKVFLTHTENLGVGGICVVFNWRVELFTPVTLEIDLMDMDDHVRCKGKVVWSVQHKEPDSRKPVSFDVGVEFVDLRDEDRTRIETIIKKLTKY